MGAAHEEGLIPLPLEVPNFFHAPWRDVVQKGVSVLQKHRPIVAFMPFVTSVIAMMFGSASCRIISMEEHMAVTQCIRLLCDNLASVHTNHDLEYIRVRLVYIMQPFQTTTPTWHAMFVSCLTQVMSIVCVGQARSSSSSSSSSGSAPAAEILAESMALTGDEFVDDFSREVTTAGGGSPS